MLIILIAFCNFSILLREHQQKTFVMLNRFLPLSRGGGGLSEFVKKGNFVMKIFYSDTGMNLSFSSAIVKIFLSQPYAE